ncbi:helix-turn-helix domain-containing protein [Pedobacter sp.]|uniref:helix-turn-helix domain-containing protein n=1 Tax=Pedobacter sp. TaxID=1411316 RepID=UPI003BAA0E35
MENDVPFFENFEDFFRALNISPSKFEGIYVDKLDKLWTYPSFEVPPFKHNFYGIKLLIKGEGVMRIGKWKQTLVSPAVYTSPPNQVVSCLMKDDNILEYALAISVKFVENHLKLKNFISVFDYFQADKSAPFVVELTELQDLMNVFDYIYDEYNSDDRTGSVEIMASAILILFMKIKRLHLKYVVNNNILEDANSLSKVDTLSNRFLKLLQEDNQNESSETIEYNIAYFASKLAVHQNYLSSKLKSETGKSAKEHLDAKIIHNAKTLLLQTDLPIKKIASNLNFKESSHFNNFFKKQTLLTPKQFRKEVY